MRVIEVILKDCDRKYSIFQVSGVRKLSLKAKHKACFTPEFYSIIAKHLPALTELTVHKNHQAGTFLCGSLVALLYPFLKR